MSTMQVVHVGQTTNQNSPINQMKDHNIKTRVLEVTPAWAERKLAELQHLVEQGLFRNRSINKSLVNAYASDMARGRWGLSHQGIAFDEDNRLIDGQHRLWAVVKAGIPVIMTVTTGVPASTNGGFSMPTMDIVDRGKNRSIGQQLHIAHGIASANQVAAAVRNIAFVYTNDSNVRLSISQTLELLEMHRISIQTVFQITTHIRQRVGPVLGPIAVYHGTHPDKAKQFAAQYLLKEDLRKGSPVSALLRWIEANPGGGREHTMKKLKVVSHCIHQYHHNQDCQSADTKDETLYWLAAQNKKHGEIIRAMLYPLRKGN